MVIGVLCGSFSPPTIAHLHLSQTCITQGLCDKVIWVPSNDAYKKQTNILAARRLAMVKLALQNEENIIVSDHELQFETTISTQHSLEMIQAMYPNDVIRFIFGADKLHYRWIQKEALISAFDFIIIPRDDIDVPGVIAASKTLSKYQHKIHIVKHHEIISSTQAREQIWNTGYSDLVNPSVLKYIRDHHCYPFQDYLFCPECHRPVRDGKCFNPNCILGYPIDIYYNPYTD